VHEKRNALDFFFAKVYDELSKQPLFALHFYLSFSKHLAKSGEITESQLQVLRKTLKNIDTAAI